MRRRSVGLGDLVESALSSVGLTSDRLSGWLGRPCNCRKRKEKLNNLSAWAARVLRGAPKDEAVVELSKLAELPDLVQSPQLPEPSTTPADNIKDT